MPNITGLIDTGERRPNTRLATDRKEQIRIERELQSDADMIRESIEHILRCNLTGNVSISILVAVKDGIPKRQIKVVVTEQFINLDSNNGKTDKRRLPAISN